MTVFLCHSVCGMLLQQPKLTKTDSENILRTLKIPQSVKSKRWASDLNRHLAKEDIQMVNQYIKKCSMSYVIREAQLLKSDVTTHLLK